jgi:tetratricopeptide (TPR) repeat protein
MLGKEVALYQLKPSAFPKRAMTLVLAVCFANGLAPAHAQYGSLIGIGTNVLRHAARHAARSSSSDQTNSGPYSAGQSVDPNSSGAGTSGSGNPGDLTGTGYYNGQTYSGTSYPANNRHSGSYIGSGSYFNGANGGSTANSPSDPASAAVSNHAPIAPFSTGTGGYGGSSGSAYSPTPTSSAYVPASNPAVSGSAYAVPPSDGGVNQGGANDRFAGGNPGVAYPTSYPGTAVNLQTGVYQPNATPPAAFQPVSYTPNTYTPTAPPSYSTSSSPPPTIYRGRHADRHSVRSINQDVKVHNEAIHLYNKGVEHLNADQYKEAIEAFDGALRIDPSLGDARHALGIAYNETQEYDKALEECRIAIQQNSGNADFYYTAGDAARHLRDFKSAYKYYNRFLSMGGSGDRADEAHKVVDILDHNYFHQASGDYLADATKEGTERWLPSSMPLKVYIDENASVNGYRPAFSTALRESFKDWQDSSQGALSFTFVDKPEMANIKCAWTAEKTKMGSLEELGLTHRMAIPENGQIISATIDLYSLFDKKGSEDQLVRTAKAVDLHEIGHALGLDHSQQSYDIMYFCSMPDGLEFPLSDRDKRTMVALYSSLPKNVATSHNASGASAAADAGATADAGDAKSITASALKPRRK